MHDPRYMPIVRIAINQLYRKYPKLIEETLFSVLFQLLSACRDRSSTGIASEDQWNTFLDDLDHLVDAVSNDDIRVYLQENRLDELINLYLAIDKSLVPSKSRYLHILINLFSSIDQDKAVQCFEQILFRMEFVPLKFLPEQTSNFALIVDPGARERSRDLRSIDQSTSIRYSQQRSTGYSHLSSSVTTVNHQERFDSIGHLDGERAKSHSATLPGDGSTQTDSGISNRSYRYHH